MVRTSTDNSHIYSLQHMNYKNSFDANLILRVIIKARWYIKIECAIHVIIPIWGYLHTCIKYTAGLYSEVQNQI